MNTEDDEFTRIERESKQRLEAVKSNIKNSQKQFLRIEDYEISDKAESMVGFLLDSPASPEQMIKAAFELGASWAEYELRERNT
jgi:hypothetical protein